MKKVAKEYYSLGLNPVPVRAGTKIPTRPSHQELIPEKEIDDHDWEEIGVSTGFASGNLEVLDFDLKNEDNPQDLLQSFTHHIGETLAKKLVVQTTPSSGYHMLYRCDIIGSNQKLAKNEEGLATIETRGIGGYIKCAPSEGYEVIRGSFESIPHLTERERAVLLAACRKQNKLIKQDNEKRISREDREYISKFPDYEDDPNIGCQLLEDHGWQVHSEDDVWVNYTRPGKDISDGISGGYNLEGNFFYCFSTSQEDFDVERPYSNVAIYAELEHGGNYKKAYRALFDAGHGRDEEDDDDSEVDFLSDEKEENAYLDQARKGEIAMGLSTGWPEVDEYFRFKPKSLNIFIGLDNVGKSLFFLHLMTSASILHGWVWGVIAPENKTAVTRQRIMEAVAGQSIKSMDEDTYNRCLKFARARFKIVSNDSHDTITEVVKKAKKLYEREGISALLIDPWNFFKVDGDAYSVDNQMLSELRIFSSNYCATYIMGHPSTGPARNNKDKDGYMKSPTKYDIQGGTNFAYRVDDFGIMHRVINHKSQKVKRTLEFRMEKIKEWETGGGVHAAGEYCAMEYDTREGFLGFWDEQDVNPLFKFKTAAESARRNKLR